MTTPTPPSSGSPFGPPRTGAAPAGGTQGQALGGGAPPAAPGAPSAPSSFSAPSQEQMNGRALSPQEERTKDALMALRSEIGKAVVGQEGAVTGLIIALVAGGHALLEGVPGVAKTLLVRTMATALDVDMARIQFTPDLMPADITGSLVWDAGSSAFEFRRGPVFTNLLLADEINRTPPKTQSALLEAMEERQVSVDGQTHALADPFMVIATQNPVEYEGTYPLPEAQLDRFLLKLELPLPGRDAEFGIVKRHRDGFNPLALADAASGPWPRPRTSPRRAGRRPASTCRTRSSPTSWTCAAPPGSPRRSAWAPRPGAPPPSCGPPACGPSCRAGASRPPTTSRRWPRPLSPTGSGCGPRPTWRG